ncbi:hypothetical protein SRABI83_01729 [Arthrobacter sp. Bi83]|uniref:Hpt domain-containing protein n=1 Tax=Arthrobacter sp. Bi83 TaxID=2822353 RepID=UPI001E03BEAF|nr:Hpt domain-containing protein [Arthrobacter sp. Bi83]CAH0193637.1 hypothetical protein SRABI83_01729 [Arthrobacter sp. Bi83]
MSSSGSSTGDGGANGVCLPASGDPVEGAADGSAGVPLLDLTVLHELEEELGGTGVARSFARDYVSIWDKRIGYLTRSVGDNDPELAMDAVLSVKNSAFMVGGSRLACLAVELERLIRSGDLSAVRRLLPIVTKTGEDTVSALKVGYLRPEQ